MTDAIAGSADVSAGRPLPPPESSEARQRRHLQYAGLWTLGLAVPAVVLALGGVYNPGKAISNATPTILGIWALLYPLYVYRLHLIRLPSFALIVACASITVAAVSIATGWGNGMTDEPYAMPIFIQPILHGQNPYTTPIYVTYNQYGTIYHLGPTKYIYLPLLIFLQPFVFGGTGYKVFVVATWAVMIYLVRKNAFAVIAIGQPYMALLAASGFNDFPVLLLLTLAFVGINGKRQKWAEYLALGCKQFANAFIVVYYVIKRDWRNLAIAIAVTLAWVLPFLIWEPAAFVCGAVIFSAQGCSGASAGGVALHLNYWAWPVWVLAIYFVPLRAYYHRARIRLKMEEPRSDPSPTAIPPASPDPSAPVPPNGTMRGALGAVRPASVRALFGPRRPPDGSEQAPSESSG